MKPKLLFFVATKYAACNDKIGTVFALRLLLPGDVRLSDYWSVIISVVGAFTEQKQVGFNQCTLCAFV